MNKNILKKILKDNEITFILNTLNKNGKGYIVGGYIRDLLMDISPKDCDFCTDIPYDKVLEIFKDYTPKEIGKLFGIVQIKVNNRYFEIAKLRKETDFFQRRNQVNIEFINNIYEDLTRRDFTINSIAFDGEQLYYLNNQVLEDINDKKLRFIGNPQNRIAEDPLRILRGIRFFTEKSLKSIDKNSYLSMKSNFYLIKNLSHNRIREEIKKIILSDNYKKGLELIKEFDINYYIFKTKINLTFLDMNIKNDICIRIFLIIYNQSDKYINIDFLTKDENLILKKYFDFFPVISKLKSDYQIRFFINKISLKFFEDLIYFYEIFGRKSEYLKNRVEFLKDNNTLIITKKDLAINGNILKELGFTGKNIGKTLDNIYKYILKFPNKNNINDIIKFLKN